MKRMKKILAFGLIGFLLFLRFDATSYASNEESKVYLVAVGDNLIHSTVYNKCLSNGEYDFNHIYDNVRDYIKQYDIAVINQETIFVDDNSKVSTYPAFGTPEVMGEAVVNSGFNTVLSATNHTMDKGLYGINNTLKYWKKNYPEVTLLGIHDSVEDFNSIDIIEKNNIKIAMFNYTYGLNGIVLPKDNYYQVDLLDYKEKFIEDVQKAEDIADITICFCHIGEEYRYTPTTYQVNYINDLIDAGADIIICAHPHVVEPMEYVTTQNGNKGLVYYSLGNFVSGQTEIDRNLGGLASIEITKNENGVKVTSFDFIPTVTHRTQLEISVYLLKDYNNSLASKHSVSGMSVEKLNELWNKITNLDIENKINIEEINNLRNSFTSNIKINKETGLEKRIAEFINRKYIKDNTFSHTKVTS